MQHALARPDSVTVLYTCVLFLCDILWPQALSHSGNSHMHATGLCSARTLAQTRPTNFVMHSSSIGNCKKCTSACAPYIFNGAWNDVMGV